MLHRKPPVAPGNVLYVRGKARTMWTRVSMHLLHAIISFGLVGHEPPSSENCDIIGKSSNRRIVETRRTYFRGICVYFEVYHLVCKNVLTNCAKAKVLDWVLCVKNLCNLHHPPGENVCQVVIRIQYDDAACTDLCPLK